MHIINCKKNKINILNRQEIVRDNLKKYIHDLITSFYYIMVRFEFLHT